MNIAIVGGGNIGSRHLQAVARLKKPIDIFVVEPVDAAVELSKSRFEEIENSYLHKLTTVKSVEYLPQALDIVIVATSSSIRKQIVELLLEHASVKYLILEKFMFTSLADFDDIAELLITKSVRAYADCARRAVGSYKEIKELLSDSKYINMYVSGGDWGLSCNGIHFFDLYAYLTGCIDFKSDNKLLDEHIYNSKRKGYIEFAGTLSLRCKKGILSLTSCKDITAPVSICLQSDRYQICVDESKKRMYIISNDTNNELETKEMDIMPTSEITTVLLQQIIDEGDCDLPSYEENAAIEKIMLEAFLSKKNEITGEDDLICPIT